MFVITVVAWGILLKIVLVPTDLGDLPPLKDLYKVLPLEVHSQLVEVEAEVRAIPQASQGIVNRPA